MRKNLISIDDLSREDIDRILDRAASFAEVSGREIKKVPTLRGRTVINLFYEASTRTSSSFELAAKRLSADLVNIKSAGSAVDKGESLKDTVLTLSAYDPAAVVIRSPHAGAAGLVARWTAASVINAGDGKHEHPTQALLDVYTLWRRVGSLDGLKIWIVGDVLHSRVARSCVLAFDRMGAEVTVCGPPTLIPRDFDRLGCRIAYSLDEVSDADVIYALRMQNERMTGVLRPVAARVRRQLPDRRPPAGRRPAAHAPGPGQPRRRAGLRGDRLAPGADHPAGRVRGRREDGRALRAPRRRRGAHAGRGRSPRPSRWERPDGAALRRAAARLPPRARPPTS